MTLVWDPPKEIFSWNLPLLGRPILWYGFLFALGFSLAYLLVRYFLRFEERRGFMLELLSTVILVGMLLGARIADLIFYQGIGRLLRSPWEIFTVWEGGLSSHGGILGICIGLWWASRVLRKEKIPYSFIDLLDLLAAPSALAGAFIRIGNFFNQEILGTVTTLPWGVWFLHPADGSPPLCRHPVQLYEALFYLSISLGYALVRGKLWTNGRLIALFFTLIFAFRFLIEFLKEEQSIYLKDGSLLTMGQWLSLPFIFGSLFFFFFAKTFTNAKKAVYLAGNDHMRDPNESNHNCRKPGD